ncbi:hypothetical protein [Novosphingobium olei]|uniref:Uncharacterized protein n=2 Tax=Novosphingobium olei TaxID=2728851 RepID=A0A7Y0G8Q6_9SPHN|nr:hypothetical protein [Novosphingobium olei]BEU99701.1 hypothetical protein NSDW_07960 [Novosphingobium olei]
MLRFAPRYGMISPCLVRPSRNPRRRAIERAVNDNAPQQDGALFDADGVLAAALRLFAAHGICAAERACEAAEIAKATGDAEGVVWWIEVCRALDRRMAREASRKLARAR